jgi:hypothetical protein
MASRRAALMNPAVFVCANAIEIADIFQLSNHVGAFGTVAWEQKWLR